MENLICNAYTYIEFSGNYSLYEKENSKYESDVVYLLECWNKVVADYETVSQYMGDSAIMQAQKLVMEIL